MNPASMVECKASDLEDFVYAASHDLKAPLLTIQGYAEWLKADVNSGREDRLEEYASRIAEGASRLRESIDDLLEVCRAGGPVRQVQAIDTGAFVASVLKDMERQVAESGAVVTVEARLPSLRGDPSRLKHVLQNLLTNAIKYGRSPNGQLHVRISGIVQDGQAGLSVADNGVGIQDHLCQKIFLPFQRLNTDTEGTGIGLSIVRRITEAHGGRAWVQATPGGGATFVVAFPV